MLLKYKRLYDKNLQSQKNKYISISQNSQHPLVKLFEKLLGCGQSYWDTKTKESYEIFFQSQDEVKIE